MAKKSPRKMTEAEIRKLSDHGLLRFRAAVLDAKQRLEERFLAQEPYQAARMPDGTDRRRGLNQRYDPSGNRLMRDITGEADLSEHKRLTFLAYATDREARRRRIGKWQRWEPNLQVDDPSSVTPSDTPGAHCPLRSQREGSRSGRRGYKNRHSR